MRHGWMLLAVLALGVGRTEESPADPPAQGRRGAATLDEVRPTLEAFLESQGGKPVVEREGILLLVGSCDAGLLREVNDSCQRATRQFCKLMEVSQEELESPDLWCLVTATRSQHLAAGQWAESMNPGANMAERFEKLLAVGSFLCADPTAIRPAAVRSLATHYTVHRLLVIYQARHGGGSLPAWIQEGLPTYLDAFVHQKPQASCVAIVGYDKDEMKMRGAGADWNVTVAKAVEQYKEAKKKKKDMGSEPFRGLVPLSGRLFDKLSGEEVAVSWHVTTELATDKPRKFKEFLDALVGGKAQAEAFEAAFGKDLDEYEKAWMKGVLKEASKK